ncbi:MAG TPA: aspartate-semialdehyde dehydrogenase [Thermoplasmata archaeon]|nr:aspartate-semialdehyde dehydrogenase [Thermoplasmata archaeon]
MTGRRPRVAVVGASGLIGQHFARLLADHPWFDEPVLVGTERTAGQRLEDIWRLPVPVPTALADRRLRTATPRALAESEVDLAFGGLPSGTAGPLETELTRRGVAVFSNAADHRRDTGVPLLVPEVNPDHLAELRRRPRGRAILVTNPNCTATGLALGLAPVWDLLRPREVHVATYQALSGAGVPGLGALGVADNVVPFIAEEEQKIATETGRILGRRTSRGIVPARTRFLANSARVPVTDGHLEAVTVVAGRSTRADHLESAWRSFDPLAKLGLPTAPHPPVLRRAEPDRPQPALDRWAGSPPRSLGMAVTVGRVRWDPPYLRCFLLSHNAVRGGAGGSVLNAELALARGALGDLEPP